MEENTVELIDYLVVIWKRKRLIIVGTLACMVTAGVVSLLLPEVYKASVTFLLEESKISKERVVSQINPGIFETYGKTYIGIIKNKTAMNQAIKEFQLDKEP
ncbi:MAG: Wzz/FepE/Etk N-terminal domain-containing protein, partial [Candidatus Brocadiales bacterium]